MTGPDRIWAWPWEVDRHRGQWTEDQEIFGEGSQYIRADLIPDPAAIVRAALEAAAKAVDDPSWVTPWELQDAIRAIASDTAAVAQIIKEAKP